MKLFALLLFVLLTRTVMGQDSLITSYWENGNPKSIEFYQNKTLLKKQLFYTDNTLWEERDLFSDSGTCRLKRYDTHQRLTLTILLDASGMMHGEYATQYDAGNPYEAGSYSHGRKEGLWKCWHPNGKLKSSYFYKQDIVLSGKEWWESGVLMRTMDSTGSVEHYYETGNKESSLISTGKNKLYTRWNEAGHKIEEGRFVNDDYFLIHYWNEQQKQTVVNGNGYVETKDGELGIPIVWKYHKGKKR